MRYHNLSQSSIMTSDEEAQEDEMLAMESIFEGDSFHAHPGEIRSGLIKIRVDLPEPFFICVEKEGDTKNPVIPLIPGITTGTETRYKVEYMPPLMLHFTMPKDYPSKAKPNFTLSCTWLHRAALTILCQKLDELWEENKGMGILFTWANFLQVDTFTNLSIQDLYDITWLQRPTHLSKKNPLNRSPLKEETDMPGDLTNDLAASDDLPHGSVASGPLPHVYRDPVDLENRFAAPDELPLGSASNDIANGSTASNGRASSDLPNGSASVSEVTISCAISGELPNGHKISEETFNLPSTSGKVVNGSVAFDDAINLPSTSRGLVKASTSSSDLPTSSGDTVNTPTTSGGLANGSTITENVTNTSGDVASSSTVSGDVTNASTTSGITEDTEDENDEDFEVLARIAKDLGISPDPEQPKAEAKKPRRKRVRKRANNKRKSVGATRVFFDPRAVTDRIPPKDGKPPSLQEFLLMYNDDQIRETFMQSSHTCDICFTLKSGQVCLRFRCGHVFCQDCVTSFFTTNIAEGNVDNVKCLAYNCKMRPTPELVKLLVKDELYERYDRILLKRALENMADVIYCPRPKCINPVICDPNEKCALCTACGYTFCSCCKMVYHGVEPCRFKDADMKDVFKKYTEGTPEEKQAMVKTYGEKQLKILVENVLSEQWIQKESKSCPHCKVPIEKFEGCNKVTCFKCNTYFCWLCLKQLEAGNPYFHFNDPSSQCYNNLFQNMEDEEGPDNEWIHNLLEDEDSDTSDDDLYFYDSDDFDY
ncbi:unnamed protein product [Orchesella dallaii]|uniref:RBR-type E3 ubiquitin transferase n=1 Tax=Orchesella dallaii TaxID=48710 RepID=A0ABP1PZ32_9HEXA